MIKEFNTYLEGIDSEFWERLFRAKGELQTYRKGEEFISIGKIAKYIGLIKSGSVKYVAYTADYEEKIVGLETAGGFAASWPYCLNNIPSKLSVVANSDLEIYCLSISKLIEMSKENIEFERQIAHSTEQMFYTIYERHIDLYTLTPTERYEILLKKCPRLFEIFSYKDIASLLNITTQHLFRIRKGLK